MASAHAGLFSTCIRVSSLCFMLVLSQFVPVKKKMAVILVKQSTISKPSTRINTFCMSMFFLDFIWDYHSFMSVRSCTGDSLLLLTLALAGIF